MSKKREPTIIQVDTETIRAQLGIDDLYSLPSLITSASYAVPIAASLDATTPAAEASGSSSRDGWIAGEALSTAQSSDDYSSKYETRWPFRHSEQEDWDGRTFVLVIKQLGTTISSNSSPLLLLPPPTSSLPNSTQALYSQMAFERLNVPAFALLPPSLAALFALGQTTGIIVHIGYEKTFINIIVDSVLREECSAVVEVGKKHCEEHFLRLLLADGGLEKELRNVLDKGDAAWQEGEKEKYVQEIADFVWRECMDGDDIEVIGATGAKVALPGKEVEDDSSFDVAKKLVDGGAATVVNTSHKSKKQIAAQQAKANAAAVAAAEAAEAAAALDVILCKIPSIPEKQVELGAVRNRLVEPLFKGTYPGGDTVWEGVGRAVEHSSLGPELRLAVWDGFSVIGDLARIRSLAPALTTYLSPLLVSSSDIPSEVQPNKVRLLAIPEYFFNFKTSTTDLAPFLGGSISAKTILSDPGLSVNKIQYNELGPAAIYTTKDESRA